MAGMGCATWTVVLDEVSLIAIRGLTRELQKFNERVVSVPGVNPDRPFPLPPPVGENEPEPVDSRPDLFPPSEGATA